MFVKVVAVGEGDKVSLTKNELEKMLQEAYEAGKKDGNNIVCTRCNGWWNGPYYTTTTSVITNPDITPYVTCNNGKSQEVAYLNYINKGDLK